MANKIRVLLADDHAAVRSTVREDLEQAGFDVCAEADDAKSAFIMALREKPDIALLDVRMPGGGLVAAWDITSQLPRTKVIMLTMSKSEDHMVAALRAGAVGYVLKDVEGRQLAQQILAFVDGYVCVSAALARRLLDYLSPAPADRRGLLRRRSAGNGADPGQRPREILSLLMDGATPSRVAAQLGVSEDDYRSELATTLAQVRYADRTSLAALSSLNA